MASQNREKRNHLINQLQDKIYQYDFFHALRLIECTYVEKPLIGKSKRAVEDPVRFSQEVTLAFQPSTLSHFVAAKASKSARLYAYFFGLFGPNGPMPLHISEYVKSRMHNFHDFTQGRFADIFHHRLFSLFYRARANVEPTFSFDRPLKDRFSSYTGSLLGIGDSSLLQRDVMPDLAKLHYAGYLSNHAKNAEGLQAIIADFFKLPVSLQQFVGEWLAIQQTELTLLGASPQTCSLGVSTILGDKVWSCQHKFRIIFGPLTMQQYESLLPTGKRLQQLIAIVRNYIGDELAWDMNLMLKSEQIKGVKLGGNARLGWTSWLGLRTSLDDVKPLLLQPI